MQRGHATMMDGWNKQGGMNTVSFPGVAIFVFEIHPMKGFTFAVFTCLRVFLESTCCRNQKTAILWWGVLTL